MSETPKYFRCSVCDLVKGVCKCKKKNFVTILGVPDINEVPKNVHPDNFMITEKESVNIKLQVIQFLDEQIKEYVLSTNDSTRVFVRLHDDRVLELMSSRFLYWLNSSTFKKFNDMFQEDTLKGIVKLIYARCIMNPKLKRELTYVRVAQNDRGLFYDLFDSERNIVRVTPDKVEISPLKKVDPIFEHSDILFPQVKPNLTNDSHGLDDFIDLVRIPDSERFVFKIHLVCLFLQKIPVPIMDLFGYHGKGKSMTSGSVKRLVDPMSSQTSDNVGKLPTKAEDFIIQCASRHLNGYDNVSHITPNQSDDFCRMVTGSNFEKRKLYFNKELVRFFLRTKFVINGIGVNINRGDFLERSLNYTLPFIEKVDRKTEKEFEKRLETIIPHALGEIFSLISKAMSVYDSIKDEIKELPRMADFALWGESISQVLKNPKGHFIDQYSSFMKETMQKAGENHALVKYIEYLMNEKSGKKRDEFNSALHEFYKAMKLWVELEGTYDLKSKFSNFPKSVQQIRPTLERVDGFLRELGFLVTLSERDYERKRGDDRGSVFITINRVTTQDSQELST